jgi:hypothetical protein
MSQILDAYRGLKLRDRLSAAPNWARKVGLLLVIAFAFYLPFLNILPFAYIRTDLSSSGSDWASVLFLVVVYMIAAVGLNVVIGFAGLLDLGYVGFYALGAYSIALFGSPSSPVVESIQNRFGLSEEWAVPFAMCIPIAIAMALTAGVILGAPTLRLRGDYLAIVTLGFGEIIRITARNLDGVTNGATGISGVPVPPGPEVDGRPFFNTIDAERWYWLAQCILIRWSSWPSGWRAAGWVAPGWPSARTRTRPRSWVWPPSSSSCGRSPSARPWAVSLDCCSAASSSTSSPTRSWSSSRSCSWPWWSSAGPATSTGCCSGPSC